MASGCVRPAAPPGSLPSRWAEPQCPQAVALPALRCLSSRFNSFYPLRLEGAQNVSLEPGGAEPSGSTPGHRLQGGAHRPAPLSSLLSCSDGLQEDTRGVLSMHF